MQTRHFNYSSGILLCDLRNISNSNPNQSNLGEEGLNLGHSSGLQAIISRESRAAELETAGPSVPIIRKQINECLCWGPGEGGEHSLFQSRGPAHEMAPPTFKVGSQCN